MKKTRKKVKPIPAGYHAVTPYLACGDAARAIDFCKKAVGARRRGEKALKPGGQ